MSLAKSIELLAEGDSIESAIENAVRESADTVRNIKHVYVKEIQAYVDGNSISKYRLNVKVTFVVEGQEAG